MAALRFLPFPFLILLAAAPALASPLECGDACDVPAASLAPAPPAAPDAPPLVPLAESLGLCAVGAMGVAVSVQLARRA